jgi:DNA mismatch repair protein MutS
MLEDLAQTIAKIDVLHCKAYIAKKYNYCKPKIEMDGDVSFVETVGLRHCLIEHINQNEIYVTNDISFDCSNKGMLLYGTNAVGKTSLIRAMGISVVMAQAGLYVPASEFTYIPYTAIYSRILGNDNLFKGLSTFAVEMSELRVILKQADQNSLVLGDEICSGTESVSALSIFVTTLQHLEKLKSNFIFATHFHEIVNYPEVTSIQSLKMYHLSVSYDRENDCLIYDRKLRSGSGDSNYGLIVAKSLYLPEDFLENAYDFRRKYFPETAGSELSNNTTTYNAKKIRGICEKCKIEIADEIHHLHPQRLANENGFIDTFHKNHPANLMGLCNNCHLQEHQNGDKPKRKVKTTKGYVVA